jgi:alkanesulfonate monooxygenase SsuD/methylene tetrahydromethanopterin reductase-like flavin-dependent oxidoreductase (luciferase family)
VARDAAGRHRVVFEGWTLLAAMAEATRRTRIGLLVSGLSYRHPALLAKQAVTVDHLSGGRLEFGIGSGWSTVEDEMFGISGRDHPAGRLAEGLEVIQRLWSQASSNFEGRYYSLNNAVTEPRPVQQPGPPIWIGAAGPAMLRLAARKADVWNPAGDGFAAAKRAGEQLLDACRVVGRDPTEIRWSAQLPFDGIDVPGMLDELRRWYEAGFTELIVYCSGANAATAADVAGDRILPALHDLRYPRDRHGSRTAEQRHPGGR